MLYLKRIDSEIPKKTKCGDSIKRERGFDKREMIAEKR